MSKNKFVSPSQGWLSPLNEAPDAVFAEKMMGNGVLLDPTGTELLSPCDGVIIAIARTQHAITVKALNGAEILMHVGIDTVSMKGDGFDVEVEEGQTVKTGQRLMSFDLGKIVKNQKSPLIPIIITNSEKFDLKNAVTGMVKAGDYAFSLNTTNDKKQAPQLNVSEVTTCEARITIQLAHGLHARPAARLSVAAKNFTAKCEMVHRAKTGNVKSPIAIMGLGTKNGDDVLIRTQGEDGKQALAEIIKQIEGGLGEKIVAPTPVNTKGVPQNTSNKLTRQAIDSKRVKALKSGKPAVVMAVTGAPGLVIGKAIQWKKKTFNYNAQGIGTQKEQSALITAIKDVSGKIKCNAKKQTGVQSEILDAHLVLLSDLELLAQATTHITSGHSASHAWHLTIESNVSILKSLSDSRMSERADDLLDLEAQILDHLAGEKSSKATNIKAGDIVFADELLPSQFLELATHNIGGLCLAQGGPTSHVSILAADKGIPTLVALGAEVLSVPNKTPVILEADRGILHVSPEKKQITAMKFALKSRQKNSKLAHENAHIECKTEDGVRIEVFANFGADSDVKLAVERGAEGCGLLRSEFLFLGRATPPSENEQYKIYQGIADDLGARPLVIRTMDIGGDKPVPFAHIPDEENPALGLRGIRVSLANEGLFLTQLRAILRVKSKAQIHIMLPMVIDLAEFRAAKAILATAQKQLGLSGKISLGIMIETPASAILADQLASEVDFFSVGTNDLSQYVLAIDRGNPSLAKNVDALHPAVLRMISNAANAANENKIWMGVCGGAASDLVAIPVLIGLGVKELSCTMARVPQAKAFIRTLDFNDCQDIAKHVLSLSSAQEIRTYIREHCPHLADWT